MMSHNVQLGGEPVRRPDQLVQRKSSSGKLAIRANALKTAVVNTNEYITEHHLDLNMFATTFFGMLDPVSGTLLYINGGHPPVFVIGPDGTIKDRLDPTVRQSACSPARSSRSWTRIWSRAIFCSATDGVTDARNPGAIVP
ncbi:MAG: SpoIIE family protein phosphatase [Anaerolineae bacterium]